MTTPFLLQGARFHTTLLTPESVVALPDGRLLGMRVDHWSSDPGPIVASANELRAYFFDASGSLSGQSVLVGRSSGVESTTPAPIYNPRSTLLADGRVLFSWEQADSAQSRTGILRHAIYDPANGAIAARFQVIQDGGGSSTGVDHAAREHETLELPNGLLVEALNSKMTIEWVEDRWLGDVDVLYTLHAADGSLVFQGQANTSDTGTKNDPAITSLGGGFFIAWTDHLPSGGDTSGKAVRGRAFSETGATLGGELLLNAQTSGDQENVDLAALPDGGAFAVWQSRAESGDAGWEVRGQRIDAQGNKAGGEVTVNLASAGDQLAPTLHAFADGTWLVAWVDGTRVDAQYFAADGSRVGDVMQVGNTATTGASIAISETIDGRILVTWGASGGVDGQFLDRATVYVYGTAASESVAGQGITHDVLVGFAGNDTLDGLSGNDYLYTGTGDDVALGSFGNDVLLGEEGSDTLDGGDGRDYLYGGAGTNVLRGGAGVDVLISQGFNDTAHGGDAGDYVYAYGTGTTTAFGDAGHDIFVMQAGPAIAHGGAGQDYFYMGAAHDEMRGGDGVDVLIGQSSGGSIGAGDLFDGGAGVDYLFLTPGSDTVVMNASSGVDVVNHFDAAHDALRLDATLAARQRVLHDFGSFTIADFGDGTAIWFIGLSPGQVAMIATTTG